MVPQNDNIQNFRRQIKFIKDQFTISNIFKFQGKMEKAKLKRNTRHLTKISEMQILSPQSIMPQENAYLKQCVNKVRHHSRIDIAKSQLKQMCGRHNPINYKSQYGFRQSWESNKAAPESKRLFSKIINESKITIYFHFFILLLYGLSFWFLSTYRIFNIQNLSYYFGSLLVVIEIIYLINSQVSTRKDLPFSWKENVRKYLIIILFLIYVIFIMVENQIVPNRILGVLPLDIVFLVKVYKRLKKLYVLLKIRIPASWRNQMEIAQLIIGCLSLVHLFSLVLFLAAQSDPINNWTVNINNFNQSSLHRYIFSLYFACTTMFTVGYGDVTPKNMYEILTILLVQVVGIINIGYVINQVGRYVSKINEKQDILYRGISDAEQISEDYKLPPQISKKLLSYVLDNQIANTKFNVEQEDNFLNKIPDQMRNCTVKKYLEVSGYNKFQLVKSNVFFLCHWTKRFQRNIADKLIRHVYSPDQCLLQTQGKQRLYILSKGKVHIQANIVQRQRDLYRKVLKVLEINPSKQVHYNVYGYTALASGLKVKLRAVAKDYSICFYVDRNSLMSAIAESQTDFQYFHEIRSKIIESKCKQSQQAPKIKSTKEHYLPSSYFIIKKQRRENTMKQKRKNLVRNTYKGKFVIQDQINISEMDIQQPKNKRTSIDQNIINLKDPDKIIKNKQISLDMIRLSIASLPSVKDQKERTFSDTFQSGHNFNYFRKKSNKSIMIHNYNQRFQKKTQKQISLESILCKTTKRFGLQNLNQKAVKRLINSKNF